ncbi:MAG TPA: MarP family serine protease [Pseudonocardiaceae bacterium]|nr:MarP family serine protease [Pseudonocardiaceae bacterium]
MNWVDLVVLLVAVLAAVSGARQGVVIALPAFAGVLLGAVVGVRIAPLLIKNFTNPATRVAFAVAILVLLVALGETFGVWCGRMLKQRIRNPKLAGIDNALGAILQGIVVFVVAWMIALPLTSYSGLPGLSYSLQHSTVLGAVNSIMPDSARALPADLRKLLNVPDLPDVTNPFSRTPVNDVGPPNTALQASAVVQDVRPSVVKIHGEAPSCSRALEGSGFVIAPQRVLTNAHVVAGTDTVHVEVRDGELDAHVVYYNSDVDVAILAVPDLTAPPLHFDQAAAQTGQDAIVLGYPLDGDYTASAARVSNRFNLPGPNIYDNRTENRDVYTVYSQVRSGNSGGPLIDTGGGVLGVVFGAAVDDPHTGFALTAQQVTSVLPTDATMLYRSVSTDQCAA